MVGLVEKSSFLLNCRLGQYSRKVLDVQFKQVSRGIYFQCW